MIHTTVIEMLAQLHIPVSPRSNVKIPLHLIPLHTPKKPTAIRLSMPRHSRRLPKLPPPLRRAQIIMHVLLPVLPKPRIPTQVQTLLLRRAQVVQFPIAPPLHPRRGILLQRHTRQYSVSTRVLHVDMQVLALHLDDDVEIDLQIMADALLHAERVRRVAHPPSSQLGAREPDAGEDEHDGPDAARVGLFGVRRFGFGEGVEGFYGFGCAGGAKVVFVQVGGGEAVVGVHVGW